MINDFKDLCGQVEDFGDDMRPNLLYSSFWTSTIIAVKGHSYQCYST